jgi:hypothetical protein
VHVGHITVPRFFELRDTIHAEICCRVLSLDALANWEAAVMASIQGAAGTPDERDAQITRSGMYAEYPAIFSTYLELIGLADDPATALEALKRAVFLAWYSFKEPSFDTGIAELPESSVRELMRDLDRAIANGRTDDELRWMLAWYDKVFGYVFEHFGPVRGLASFIGRLSAGDAYDRRQDLARFTGRGQLGAYWKKVLG